jgi:hypothetical protein
MNRDTRSMTLMKVSAEEEAMLVAYRLLPKRIRKTTRSLMRLDRDDQDLLRSFIEALLRTSSDVPPGDEAPVTSAAGTLRLVTTNRPVTKVA